MTDVSIALLVRNEERGIRRAIESVRLLYSASEIVVLDTGSDDETPQIAASLGARVFFEAWTNDFSAHRNYLEDVCINDWILTLDGDEWLSDHGEIDSWLQGANAEAAGITVRCVDTSGTELQTFVAPRLHNRRYGRWQYPVHEQFVGPKSWQLIAGEIAAEYDSDSLVDARLRLECLLQGAIREPQDLHYAYFLTETYCYLGESENVLTWGRRVIEASEMGDSRWTKFAPVIWVWMISAALDLDLVAEARQMVRVALHRHPTHPDLHHAAMSMAAMDWYNASLVRTRDPTVPVSTPRFAANFRQAGILLGIPFEEKAYTRG